MELLGPNSLEVLRKIESRKSKDRSYGLPLASIIAVAVKLVRKYSGNATILVNPTAFHRFLTFLNYYYRIDWKFTRNAWNGVFALWCKTKQCCFRIVFWNWGLFPPGSEGLSTIKWSGASVSIRFWTVRNLYELGRLAHSVRQNQQATREQILHESQPT